MMKTELNSASEYIFVVEVKSKTLKVITKKYYSKAALARKTMPQVKTNFYKFPELVLAKSTWLENIRRDSTLTMGAKFVKIEDEYPGSIPLILLEYKEFYNKIKDNLYLQFLPNSRPIKADESKIKTILKINPGVKTANIDGKLKEVRVVIGDNLVTIEKGLKEYPQKIGNFNVRFIMHFYRGVKTAIGFNAQGFYQNNLVFDPETQKFLKTDPKIKDILEYFDFDPKRTKSFNNPYQINFQNFLDLHRKFNNNSTSNKIKINFQTYNGKLIDFVSIEEILEAKNYFISKIMEARAQNKIYVIHNKDYFIFDPNEIDKFEDKILDKLLSKTLKEFLDKMKELSISKSINEEYISKAKKHGLNADLYEHQKIALSWFERLYEKHAPGAILADKMGAGKTLQTISFMSLHPEKDYLIICPASVIGVWEQEIEKFNPKLAKGLGRKIKILSYEKAMYSKPAKTDILILDEAQKIKNNKSLTFGVISAIKKDFVIIATGTPIENKIDDLFSLLEVINSSAYDILNIFKKLYKKDEQKLILKTRTFIDPIFLQRDISKELIQGKLNLVEDYIDPIQIELELQEEIKRIYSDKLLKINAENNHDFYSAQAILTGILRLRQAISNPAQLPEDLIHHFSPKLKTAVKTITPSKYKDLKRKVNTLKEKNEKIVIFTEFKETMSYLKLNLEKEGHKVLTLSGSDSSTKRKIMIKEFQEGNTFNVFIIALKAGNSGITLTNANNVYIYDLFWNPAVLSQAIARVHRIGQDKDVQAYFSILKNTIDESIYKAIIKKTDIIKTFENGSGASGNSSTKDLIDLGANIFGVKKPNSIKG